MELRPDRPELTLLHTCPENVLVRPLMQPVAAPRQREAKGDKLAAAADLRDSHIVAAIRPRHPTRVDRHIIDYTASAHPDVVAVVRPRVEVSGRQG